jgi:HlyD family secretion protein
MSRRSMLVGLVLAAAVAASAGMYVYLNGTEPPDDYRTEILDRGSVSEAVTATGTISAVTMVQVGSQVSGIISRLHADYNTPVKRGELLAELDPTPFQAQVEQRRADLMRAEVEMRNAESTFRRTERLLTEGLQPEADYDSAKAAYGAAQAQVDLTTAALRQARTNLSYTKIYSPIDGVVVARQYDIGQTVAASFQAPTLFTIAEDLTKMRVQVDVDQSDIGRVTVGQTARFTVDAYPEETFQGTISQIRLNATQNQNVVTYPVIIDVANPQGKLKPLMTADVTIEVAHLADVLRVPNAALRFRPIEIGRSGQGADERDDSRALAGDGRPRAESARAASGPSGASPPPRRQQLVYTTGPDGALRAVPVKTGITDGRYTQVLEGDLKVGERIAVGFATAKSGQDGTFPGVAPGRGRRPF